jgi:creatinine amidohydrolase/Fe(II)-dependent formamide hydrolase-like protein/imidazolonepropionase-like amidohydrolase
MSGTAQIAVTLFEGARLIVGDGQIIDDAAFVVEGSRFAAVGRKGQLQAPSGAARVDLAGKTVMPAIVDVHSHLGFLDMATGTMSKDNFTRENLAEHLERYAYFGVAATCSFGTDFGDLPFQMRDEDIPNAALYRTVGRGLAWPGSGPGDASRNDVPYAVTSEEQARAAVRELAAKKPDFVKIWVDNRNGTKQKLTPPLFRAAVDEARRHNLSTVAHVFDLADTKELVRAGVEGFTHMVRDMEVDEELLALLKERPAVWFTPNLGGINQVKPVEGTRTAWLDEPLVRETIPPDMIERRRAALLAGGGRRAAATRWDVRNTAKMKAAGVRLPFGSDSAGDSNRWLGPMVHLELENFVAAGFTPGETIVAATRLAAEALRLDQLGTIAPRKSADFIVLDQNPLDNIANTRRIANVYLRGREVDRVGLRAKWQARWKRGTATVSPDNVFLEDLTWTEVRDALNAGTTTIIIPTGGTEQNGPHMALGKHNYLVKYKAAEIAKRVGQALVAPVVAYVPEGAVDPPSGHMRFPGTITTPQDVFEKVLEFAARSFKQHGFRDIAFLGDSGGNQAGQRTVATRLNQEWAAISVRVHHLSDYYPGPADAWLKEQGVTEEDVGSHASIHDTASLMVLNPQMLRLNKLARGVSGDGTGVVGNPALSTVEYGRRILELQIAAGAQQLRSLRESGRGSGQ